QLMIRKGSRSGCPIGFRRMVCCRLPARQPEASHAIENLQCKNWLSCFRTRCGPKSHVRQPNPPKQRSRNASMPSGSKRYAKSTGGKTGFKTDSPSLPNHTDGGKTSPELLSYKKYTENVTTAHFWRTSHRPGYTTPTGPE